MTDKAGMGEEITPERVADLTEELSETTDYRLLPHGVARAARQLIQQVAIMQADLAGRRQFAEQPPTLQPGLQIGCGANILPGYTNLDIFPNEGVDVVCDARQGLPFADGQFETVFSEHMLEHIDYPRSTKLVLREMARVTRPGGLVIVGVPDASIPVRAYAAGDEAYFAELRDRWYGRRSRLEHYDQPIDFVRLVMADEDDDPVYTPHFWAFDRDKLTALMAEAGLTDIQPWAIDPAISLEKRHWGSLYLQGVKPLEEGGGDE